MLDAKRYVSLNNAVVLSHRLDYTCIAVVIFDHRPSSTVFAVIAMDGAVLAMDVTARHVTIWRKPFNCNFISNFRLSISLLIYGLLQC
jgi:hypothetical protein